MSMSQESLPHTTFVVRNAKNAVLKEYLCLKKPKLLSDLVANNFPVPKRVTPKTIKFIDVDAISTDTGNSQSEDHKLAGSPKLVQPSLNPELLPEYPAKTPNDHPKPEVLVPQQQISNI